MISQDGKPGQIISPNPRYRHNLLIIIKGGGADVPHFETKTKSQRNSNKKKSYRSEILHGSCFIRLQYGTVKKRRRNRRKIRRETAVFGGCAAVSSQFHIVPL